MLKPLWLVAIAAIKMTIRMIHYGFHIFAFNWCANGLEESRSGIQALISVLCAVDTCTNLETSCTSHNNVLPKLFLRYLSLIRIAGRK